MSVSGDCTKTEGNPQEAEAKFKAIFNAVQAAVIVIDPETHRIVDANPAALELIEGTREGVIGTECHRFICPAEKGRCPVTDLGQKIDKSERVLLRSYAGLRCLSFEAYKHG